MRPINFYLLPTKWCGYTKLLDLIKLLCAHDFSRVTFAAELFTNLVYNSIFVIIMIIYFFIYYFSLKLSGLYLVDCV